MFKHGRVTLDQAIQGIEIFEKIPLRYVAIIETQQKFHWTPAYAGVTPVVQSVIPAKVGGKRRLRSRHHGVGNEINDILLLSFI